MSISPAILHQSRFLTIRRLQVEDASILFARIYSNPEFMHLVRLNGTVQTEIQIREQITQRLQVSPADSGILECMIIHQQYGAIGIVNAVDYVPLYRRAELVVGLFDPAHRSSGYGAEAVGMMLDLLFNAYNLHRVCAYAYSHNHLSQKTLQAAGFNEEGVMQGHLFDCQTQQFIDLHIFGMTINQFRQNQRIARLSKRLMGRDITQPLLVPPTPTNSPQANSSSKPNFMKSGAISVKQG